MVLADLPTRGAVAATSVAGRAGGQHAASRSTPLADVIASIASAATATRNGERGFEVNATGIARLRGTAESSTVGTLVFVPAAASAADLEAIVARHLAAVASTTFAIPGDRIAVVLN